VNLRDVVTGLIVEFVDDDGPNRFHARFPDGEIGSELRHHWQPISDNGQPIDWPDTESLAA
jgi:hypothetical protein